MVWITKEMTENKESLLRCPYCVGFRCFKVEILESHLRNYHTLTELAWQMSKLIQDKNAEKHCTIHHLWEED